ncbi:unnamed protein product [Diatraea saccharalis]|uniref:Uncharacterized protein n=1 Tax=Diatraea saccharalis TaxID=40085 RepID=A0A9N9R2A7_9NEOP|nr:unnamed protein product [Diatraea saccharalis]
MLLFKIAPVFLLAFAVGAEKKIELQDIEEDNLKSEKEKDFDKSEPRSESGQSSGLPLEFLKNGLLRYFESPTHGQQPQQPRYVQQYAVTEPPERPTVSTEKGHYPSTGQQAMVGYLSNVPMQIYLVPQYYNEQPEQAVNAQPGVQYTAPSMPRVAYPTAPEAVQTQTNYIEVPAYVTPTGKAYVQQYSSPVAYVSYTPPPTVAPTQATVTAPVLAYPVPVVQYPTAIVAPPVVPKGYYHNSQYENNAVEETRDNDEEQKHYVTQTDAPYTKSPEYPRYYSSRAPIRDEYRHSSISELPPPSPLLLKGPPPHLSHIPKALPMYRPLSKPVYASAAGLIQNAYTPRPSDAYGVPYKRRPNSLLESYIPSSLQFEYLKRGYNKDPLALYEALSSGRHHSPVAPRHYERGFLPNQMYHTAAGGVTYGHYKRTPKIDKASK